MWDWICTYFEWVVGVLGILLGYLGGWTRYRVARNAYAASEAKQARLRLALCDRLINWREHLAADVKEAGLRGNSAKIVPEKYLRFMQSGDDEQAQEELRRVLVGGEGS